MLYFFLLGRIIFGLYWLDTAYKHTIKSAGLIGYAQSRGVKSPKVAVYGTGVLALIGGLSILLGIYPLYGIAALVIFLVGVSFKMHEFWADVDPATRMNNEIAFYKNMAIVGALLMMTMIPMPWSF